MSMLVDSERFIDINKVQHRFPGELHEIGFAATLLHYHSHAPRDFVLVYKKDFTISEYYSQEEAQQFYPCSWYLDGTPKAYQFSDQNLPFDLESIQLQLQILEQRGYKHYGTTVRPINEVVELESKDGHVYVSQFKLKENYKFSETAMNGKKLDGCYSYSRCVITSSYAHATDYGHSVH